MPVWLNLIVFPWGFLGILAVIGFMFIKTVLKGTKEIESGENSVQKYWKSLTFYAVAFIFVIWAAQALQQYRPTSVVDNSAQQEINQRENEIEQFLPPTEIPTLAPSLDITIEENTEERKEKNDSIKDAFKDLPDANTTPVGGVTPSEGIK